jgi:hypothetical protein
MNYVSCSPFRVPIARLAAAQAAIEEKRSKSLLNGKLKGYKIPKKTSVKV